LEFWLVFTSFIKTTTIQFHFFFFWLVTNLNFEYKNIKKMAKKRTRDEAVELQ